MNKNKKINKSRLAPRKTNKRGSRGSRGKVNITKINLALPDSEIVKLKYSEFLTRAPGNIFDEYVYSANGCFDPNVTGTGGQPLLWDQYSTLYVEYFVSHSKIEIECLNTNNTSGLYLVVFPTTSSIGVSLLVDAQSQDYSHRTFCGINTSLSKCRLRNNIHIRKLWGHDISREQNFRAAVSAQPSNQAYWVINAYAADNSTNVTYDLNIKLTYTVRFEKRFYQDQSAMSFASRVSALINSYMLRQKFKQECIAKGQLPYLVLDKQLVKHKHVSLDEQIKIYFDEEEKKDFTYVDKCV